MTLPADPARKVTASLWLPSWLVGCAQNLRLYERRGLLDPGRTAGGTRRYSSDDLDRLRRIGETARQRSHLAGIALVLDLELDNARLRAELDDDAT